jgi:hypothetical protein
MNKPASQGIAAGIARDLRAHLALCEDFLALATGENRALAGADDYLSADFDQRRKDLLPRLDQSLMLLRKWRRAWQEISPAERAGFPEVKALFEAVQGLLMRVLLLDRENQQALLRRGLLPARHVPALAAQRPHCVADLYRRHTHSH